MVSEDGIFFSIFCKIIFMTKDSKYVNTELVPHVGAAQVHNVRDVKAPRMNRYFFAIQNKKHMHEVNIILSRLTDIVLHDPAARNRAAEKTQGRVKALHNLRLSPRSMQMPQRRKASIRLPWDPVSKASR